MQGWLEYNSAVMSTARSGNVLSTAMPANHRLASTTLVLAGEGASPAVYCAFT